MDHLKINESYSVLTNSEARKVSLVANTETKMKGIPLILHTSKKNY